MSFIFTDLINAVRLWLNPSKQRVPSFSAGDRGVLIFQKGIKFIVRDLYHKAMHKDPFLKSHREVFIILLAKRLLEKRI